MVVHKARTVRLSRLGDNNNKKKGANQLEKMNHGITRNKSMRCNEGKQVPTENTEQQRSTETDLIRSKVI